MLGRHGFGQGLGECRRVGGRAAARPVSLQAEVDGEQLQQMMRSEAGKVYAQVFVDDVWQKCNGGLFLPARW